MNSTMVSGKITMAAFRLLWMVGLLAFVSSIAKAERLPIKTYTTADGLAHNVVNRVVRDSRGFLWFCTREGLSRFDGYGFTNYGVEQGLPAANVEDLMETQDGIYWVATAGGLCRFNPLGKPQANNNGSKGDAPDAMFTVHFPAQDSRSRYIFSLLQDHTGALWCGTRNGLYRIAVPTEVKVKFEFVDLGIPEYFESSFIECLLEDRQGTLWAGSHDGLYRRWSDGRVETYTTREGLPHNVIRSLLEDRDGRMWVGTGWGGLCRLIPDPIPGRNVVDRAYYSGKNGLPTGWIKGLFQTTSGSLWAGSIAGLIQIVPTADGRDFRFRTYAEAQGVSFHVVNSLTEDRNGNLWLVTEHGGVAKIARNGFITFGETDGFFRADSILETRTGELIVVGASSGASIEGWSVNRFDGEKFIPIRPQSPEVVKRSGYGWGWNQTVLEDHTGEWWIATAVGLCRYPKVSKPQQLAQTPPKALYTIRDGLAANTILRLFEDARGDIWISSVGHGVRLNGLSRWERSTGRFHHYTEKDNLPRFDTFFVSSFAADRSGNLWIGFSGDGGLVRYRDSGFTLFTSFDGMPAGQIRNLFVDGAGRLWVASSRGGLTRIDDPTADRPTFFSYTVANGLSSNEIAGVTEDQWGRIYVGTGRGIDRFHPTTGHIKHYTVADGLPLGVMNAALRDHQGALWFSFVTGLVRLVPEPDSSPVPPPILITGLRIAGEAHSISALGEVEISPIELDPHKNQLQIDFVALGFSPGEGLRYQYKLEGATREWSPLTDQRAVNFANLAPGRYRFLVRAVNADLTSSDRLASFSFTILSPIWRRWWFLSLATFLVVLAIYSMYRYQLMRKLEVERVRTRIATDLHDDIGAGLSRMAILSEVVKRQVNGTAEQSLPLLTEIADSSRGLVESMREIVWAIDPRRDELGNVISRVRRFASDVLEAQGITWDFKIAPELELIKLDPERRRHLFLIFKEAINNIARHADCRYVSLSLTLARNQLCGEIRDDGCGFIHQDEPVGTGRNSTEAARELSFSAKGHGLENMRRRAAQVGGHIHIDSVPGQGVSVKLMIPLKK